MALTLVTGSVSLVPKVAETAAKPSLNKSYAAINVGGKVKISLKNGSKKANVKWKTSNKKVAAVVAKNSKGKSAYATVKGIKKGTAKITAVYKLGKNSRNLTCKVTVKKEKPTSAPASEPKNQAPQETSNISNTISPTNEITKAPDVQATVTPDTGTENRPGTEATPTPDTGTENTPGTEATPTPDAGAENTPGTEATETPDVKTTNAPTATPVPARKNDSDVTELNALITEQRSKGAGVSTNLDSKEYTWDVETGRLIEIHWNEKGLKGQISFGKLTALESVEVESNKLEAVDVKNNKALRSIFCYNNLLKELDVSGMPALEKVSCWSGILERLDVHNSTALEYLYCGANRLTELDVSGNTKLLELFCGNNRIAELDISNNKELKKFECAGNSNLMSIDVSGNTKLEYLDCSYCALQELDVSKNTALTGLLCYECNWLTYLDISKNTELTSLNCEGTRITELNVGSNMKLNDITCYADVILSGRELKDQNDVDALKEMIRKQVMLGSDVSGNLNMAEYLWDVNTGKLIGIRWDGKHLNGEISFSPFESLKTVSVTRNELLTKLDVSANTALSYLNCLANKLTKLDVSGNTALSYLDCRANELTKLDVSGNTALSHLDCANNNLSKLDVSSNTALAYLDCSNNSDLKKLDVSANTGLSYLECRGNGLTKLDVSGNTALEELYCGYNNLTELDVSNNLILGYLRCQDNNLAELDVSVNTALKWLGCSGNNLKELDVSANKALKYLDCYNNELTELNVSGHASLSDLLCYNNELTELNVSGDVSLYSLDCYNNKLTELDLSDNTELNFLRCKDNDITELDLTNNKGLTWSSIICDDNVNIIGGPAKPTPKPTRAPEPTRAPKPTAEPYDLPEVIDILDPEFAELTFSREEGNRPSVVNNSDGSIVLDFTGTSYSGARWEFKRPANLSEYSYMVVEGLNQSGADYHDLNCQLLDAVDKAEHGGALEIDTQSRISFPIAWDLTGDRTNVGAFEIYSLGDSGSYSYKGPIVINSIKIYKSKLAYEVAVSTPAPAKAAYYTEEGDSIRAEAGIDSAEWEDGKGDIQKTKVMNFVDTSYWEDIYEQHDAKAITFSTVSFNIWNPIAGDLTGYPEKAELAEDVWRDDVYEWVPKSDTNGRVIWDEDYLYVLFDVNDTDISPEDCENQYMTDSVEFCFDEDNNRAAGYGAPGESSAVQLRVGAVNNMFSSNDAGTGKYELVAHAVRYKLKNGETTTESIMENGKVKDELQGKIAGYQVEYIIKFTNEHEAGDMLGMDFQINDCFTYNSEYGEIANRACVIVAYDNENRNYESTVNFGRIELVM